MADEKSQDNRPMGRPRIYREPRRKITLMLSEQDVAAIEARGITLTAFVTAAIREKLARDN